MKEAGQPKPTGLGAEIAKAVELVNYQDGSIVSREIVKKPTGTVTIFAFDEGQGLSEHTAPFDALVHVLEGDVEISIAGKPHRLQSGEMILMPAHQPRALKALKPYTSSRRSCEQHRRPSAGGGNTVRPMPCVSFRPSLPMTSSQTTHPYENGIPSKILPRPLSDPGQEAAQSGPERA